MNATTCFTAIVFRDRISNYKCPFLVGTLQSPVSRLPSLAPLSSLLYCDTCHFCSSTLLSLPHARLQSEHNSTALSLAATGIVIDTVAVIVFVLKPKLIKKKEREGKKE